jgi:hypothetical protein
MRTVVGLLGVIYLTFICASPVSADVVTRWNANAGKAALAVCLAPEGNGLYEARMYATMHIAIHDALNAIDRRAEPYVFRENVHRPTSRRSAVAAAARGVLAAHVGATPLVPPTCIEAGLASVNADYATALAEIPDGPAKARGLELGRAAAEAILAVRLADGSDSVLLVDTGYAQGTRPGEYRFTPGTPFAFAPRWGEVTPFALASSTQFLPAPPYDVRSRKYAANLNEVKAFGGDDVTTMSERTADQTQFAHFWVESSPLQWNRIARMVSARQHLDLWENARLFGLLNIALADAYIASWATKYGYDFWRPVTAIQLAGTDGNPLTIPDPLWTPLRPTPPIPDYDSGHAIQGGAAAQVLKRFFGRDRIGFKTCSLTLLEEAQRCGGASEVLRSFRSFSQAANENGVSRIMVGFHFRDAVRQGIVHGRKVADWVFKTKLEPLSGKLSGKPSGKR